MRFVQYVAKDLKETADLRLHHLFFFLERNQQIRQGISVSRVLINEGGLYQGSMIVTFLSKGSFFNKFSQYVH